jgi:CheY-like chemotaxis protein
MNPDQNKTDLKILVAEDNFVNRTLLKKIFEKLGYDAHLSNNGLEAVNAFDTDYYHLVFMDIEMPEMDGFEATEKIKERFKNESRSPVIVALTANSLSGERERCMQHGMDDYLAKPFTMEDVQRLISSVKN